MDYTCMQGLKTVMQPRL